MKFKERSSKTMRLYVSILLDFILHSELIITNYDRFKELYTAISRKVVGKIVHATIPKGNLGYDQYTVPDDCRCRIYFCCFPLALESTLPWPFVPILSNFFEERRTQNHPQCLSGLSRALFPTTFPEIAVNITVTLMRHLY